MALGGWASIRLASQSPISIALSTSLCMAGDPLTHTRIAHLHLHRYHAREKYEAPPPERSKYHQPDDSVVLEDQSGRIAITGKIAPGELVSGVVMAILGHQDEDGDFVAEDVCFCDGAAQSMADEPADDVFVALVRSELGG